MLARRHPHASLLIHQNFPGNFATYPRLVGREIVTGLDSASAPGDDQRWDRRPPPSDGTFP